MFLYKVKVEDAEFKYDVFSEFSVIAESEEKVVDVSNVKSGYENSIISCNYINA